jgi:hypothetical protein
MGNHIQATPAAIDSNHYPELAEGAMLAPDVRIFKAIPSSQTPDVVI